MIKVTFIENTTFISGVYADSNEAFLDNTPMKYENIGDLPTVKINGMSFSKDELTQMSKNLDKLEKMMGIASEK